MNPIDFEGQRSRSQLTNMIYGDKLVKTIETKPLCISSSNCGGAEVAGWTLDWKIRVRFSTYPHRAWAL